MDILKEIVENFFNLANAMSLYILLGLLFAGILKEILPENFISKHLGKSNFISVIKATLLGVPMPVCSCSVIPLAKSLQKEGASKGAVQSFLISTPITGVDSIFATYSFFGWFFTVYRVLTSIIIAIFTGFLQNIFDNKRSFSTATNSFSMIKPVSVCKSGCCSSKKDTIKSFSIKRVVRYAFDTLFSDIAKSLFIGLIIGALFSTFLPKELLGTLGENLFLTYFLILAISMPLYVCATSSLPIGASLLFSGVPVGAVFVFLNAGPATNSVTMSVVKEMFGKKAFLIYIFSIAFFSIFFGYMLDIFFHDIDVFKNMIHTESYNTINHISTAVMLFLMVYFIWRKR